MKYPTIFETETIGVGGAREAVAVFHFCSKECRNMWKGNDTDEWGEDDSLELLPQEQCNTCGKCLEETC